MLRVIQLTPIEELVTRKARIFARFTEASCQYHEHLDSEHNQANHYTLTIGITLLFL